MKHRNRLLAASSLAVVLAGSAQAQTDLGLQTVSELGSLNGQALACQELQSAQRAKRLMLAHAPKTQRFGSAFDEHTQRSFLAQTSGKGTCPDAAALSAQLNAIALKLQAHLPAATSANPAAAASAGK